MPANSPPPESEPRPFPDPYHIVDALRALESRWVPENRSLVSSLANVGPTCLSLLHSFGSLRVFAWLRPVIAPLLAGACVMIVALASLLALRGGGGLNRDAIGGSGGISRRGGAIGNGGVIGGVNRGGNGGAGGGEEFKVDMWVEREMLRHAEAVYQDNMRRRSEFFGGRSQPLDLDMRQEVESVLVAAYPCPMEERLGIWADGGKWICNMRTFIPEQPIIYSIGSNGEYTFEQDISARLHSRPFTFDPFLDPVLEQTMLRLPFLSFEAVGLAAKSTLEKWKEETKGKAFMTLDQVMTKHNHTHIDILKIDCEGCEAVVLFDILPAADVAEGTRPLPLGTPPIGQMIIEFHDVGNPSKTLFLVYHLEKMGYRIFHVEQNAQHPECCTEISFIHESLIYPI
ncbi:hypothetical protein CLOM_g5421 [Closterium sp. NIES-68]|nr:hypothetical protein CLOM_g5421 [Closterium sp. NIES-68]GJP78618.1 hypothetical protein CLOP_g8899 [Closterium sp. NIES-67]